MVRPFLPATPHGGSVTVVVVGAVVVVAVVVVVVSVVTVEVENVEVDDVVAVVVVTVDVVVRMSTSTCAFNSAICASCFATTAISVIWLPTTSTVSIKTLPPSDEVMRRLLSSAKMCESCDLGAVASANGSQRDQTGSGPNHKGHFICFL